MPFAAHAFQIDGVEKSDAGTLLSDQIASTETDANAGSNCWTNYCLCIPVASDSSILSIDLLLVYYIWLILLALL